MSYDNQLILLGLYEMKRVWVGLIRSVDVISIFNRFITNPILHAFLLAFGLRLYMCNLNHVFLFILLNKLPSQFLGAILAETFWKVNAFLLEHVTPPLFQNNEPAAK
jgi:hypothetical protein